MDFRKIEAFLTIARTGKFIDAADKLFLSQSALSKQMKQLEEELGVELFRKTHNGTELTQAGWEFYSYARKAFPEYERMVNRLRINFQDGKIPLRVGSLPLSEEYGFAESMSSFWVDNPAVQIEYFERNQADLLDKLERHKLDIAFTRIDLIDSDKFDSKPLMHDELALVCPTDHPLAALQRIGVPSLRNETFILLEDKSDITRLFKKACLETGFHPSVTLHHSRHRMLVKAVQKGMGVTVLPRQLLASAHVPNLACVPFEKPIISTLGLAWLKDESIDSLIERFIEYVCTDFHAG